MCIADHSCTSHAVSRVEERGDVQRSPRQLRQFHEYHAAGGVPNQRGGRQVLEAEGVLYSWEHGVWAVLVLSYYNTALTVRLLDKILART